MDIFEIIWLNKSTGRYFVNNNNSKIISSSTFNVKN